MDSTSTIDTADPANRASITRQTPDPIRDQATATARSDTSIDYALRIKFPPLMGWGTFSAVNDRFVVSRPDRTTLWRVQDTLDGRTLSSWSTAHGTSSSVVYVADLPTARVAIAHALHAEDLLIDRHEVLALSSNPKRCATCKGTGRIVPEGMPFPGEDPMPLPGEDPIGCPDCEGSGEFLTPVDPGRTAIENLIKEREGRLGTWCDHDALQALTWQLQGARAALTAYDAAASPGCRCCIDNGCECGGQAR